jgi:ABC-type amino acid transport system permease subunit
LFLVFCGQSEGILQSHVRGTVEIFRNTPDISIYFQFPTIVIIKILGA